MISSTTRIAGPYAGTGLQTVFGFSFKVFQASDVLVVQTDALGNNTTLALTSGYSVSLNSNQDTSPGGTITTVATPAAGTTITISSQVQALQGTNLTNAGNFYPTVVNNALDYLTILVQQVLTKVSNSLQLPLNVVGVSTTLPTPSGGKVIGWNNTATALQNFSANDLGSSLAYGQTAAQISSGVLNQTAFTLSSSAVTVNNLKVAVGGVNQRPGIDYTLSSDGLVVTFTTAPPAGTNNICFVWQQALSMGTVPTNGVGTAQIIDANVTAAKIVDLNVTPAKLANSGYELGMRNRIINGGMTIDQRYSGAAISAATLGSAGFMVDRFGFQGSQSAKFSAQQNSGGVTPPAGLTNYLGLVTAAAFTVGASDSFSVYQKIEGLNVADIGWGTANAQPVTVSFRVYSSLTGTFGGSVQNNAGTRSYPFTYSVPVASTWTTVSITIPGDTSGTWLKDNSTGLFIQWGLGVGSTYSGAAGAWAGANYVSATGAVSVVGTLSATFYITGIQLEKGSTATPFEFRPYGMELALCHRYFQGSQQYYGLKVASGYARVSFPIPVMRAAPTVTYADNGGTANRISTFTGADVRTDGRTPVAVTSGNTGAFFVLPNNTDSDIAFTTIASLSAEL
jgi:hypothetical protein